MSNETVKGALNKNNAPAKKELTFPAMLEAYKGEIARALPRHMNPDRLARIALTEFRKTPRLAECDPKSVFAAIIISSQLGLEPGLLGQAYLVPFKTECQLIPGYQGLIDLVRRTGKVKRIEAHVVRDGDKFTYKTGLVTVLEHEPNLDTEPGEMRLAYAVAEFTDGGFHVEVMTRYQIEAIRNNSQGYKSAIQYKKDHPWISNTEEMWRKTLIRRICKYLPKSAELMTALALDDAAHNGPQGIDLADAVTGDWNGPIIDVSTTPEPETKSTSTETKPAPEEPKKEAVPEPTPDSSPIPKSEALEKQRSALSKKLMEAVRLYPENMRDDMYRQFFSYFHIDAMPGLKQEDFDQAQGYIDNLVKEKP